MHLFSKPKKIVCNYCVFLATATTTQGINVVSFKHTMHAVTQLIHTNTPKNYLSE